MKFLSEEWAQAVTDALNGNEGFRNAARGQQTTIQQVVNTPDGEIRYYLRLADGQAEVALGDIDNPEATISQDYDTAVALSKNETTATAAYMSGKIKVSGDLMRLMQLQGVFNTVPAALRDLDVEY